VGERLAGKDTVGDYLQERYGAFHIKYSNILDEMLDILDQPKSRRNEIDLGMALREIFKEGVLNAAIKKKVLEAAQDLKVVNGIRFQDEFDTVKSLGAKFVYITAPQEVLYQRFLKRNQKADDNSLTAQEFANLENEPTEIKISQLGAQADFKIENTGTLEDLYKKVDEIIGSME
jgi:dephospho-CoA kinase